MSAPTFTCSDCEKKIVDWPRVWVEKNVNDKVVNTELAPDERPNLCGNCYVKRLDGFIEEKRVAGLLPR